MRFVIYKNSFLASIVSIFGSASIVMAVAGLINKEIEILPGIGMIAVGILLFWLGSVISKKKEARKNAKAAGTKSTASAVAAAPSANYKPVKGGLVFAAILFLIVFALCVAFANNYSVHGTYNYSWNSEQVALGFMSVLLFIGALRSRHTQESSIWFLIAFFMLAMGSLDVFMVNYEKYGFGGYGNAYAVHHMMVFAPMVRGCAYLLLAIFSLCSMRKVKKALGGIVKVFWWLPCLALIVAFVKWTDDNYILAACKEAINPRWVGLKFLLREVPEALARMLMILAVFIISFSLQRFCRKPAAAVAEAPAAEPVQAAPRYTAPAEPVQPKPEPNPQYTAPEQPRKPEPDSNANLVKELQAYQSLLDSGILTQEEYNQKIRELTRR